MTQEHHDQPVKLLPALSTREHIVDRCGQPRIARRLGTGLERRIAQLAVRTESGISRTPLQIRRAA